MSDQTPIPPPSRYVPACPEWLEGWVGLGAHHRKIGRFDAYEDRVIDGTQRPPLWYSDGGWDIVDGVLLDPTRPEVRHLLADRLGLGMECRRGEWAVPLAWFAGCAGQPLVVIAEPAGTFRLARPDEWAAAIESGADVPAVSLREWDVPRLTREMIAEMQPPKPNRAQRRARR